LKKLKDAGFIFTEDKPRETFPDTTISRRAAQAWSRKSRHGVAEELIKVGFYRTSTSLNGKKMNTWKWRESKTSPEMWVSFL
jgi:hypothetical protein